MRDYDSVKTVKPQDKTAMVKSVELMKEICGGGGLLQDQQTQNTN